jgi:DNA-binding GntR family transcriptional regulator
MARSELDPHTHTPLYVQLADIVRADIASGKIKPRTFLPSSKALRDRHGCSSGTVERAMGILKDEGLIASQPGLGFYACPPGAG